MSQHERDIRDLIHRIRRRWRAVRLLNGVARAAIAVAFVAAVVTLAAKWMTGAPLALAAFGLIAIVAAVVAIAWGLLPLRGVPDDRHVARFIEEREPSLDDRLVSAIDVADRQGAAPELGEAMMADAARRLGALDADAIVPGASLRKAGARAAVAAAILLAMLVYGRHATRQTVDAIALTLFPSRVTLDVTPGNARVKAGAPLAIQARLVGNTAPVAAQVQTADGDAWRAAAMATQTPGAFHLSLDSVWTSFKYRVVAGTVVSPTFEVTVVKPPRVARIDVDYTYPPELKLPPHTERDGGDVYAPPGTDVRLRVVTDPPAVTGRLALTGGRTIDLAAGAGNELSASLKVTGDGSYRVALADREGMSTDGDTEYFIRTLEDRPPDVRVTKPASDRSVTRLEEIEVEAQAEDDYGIERLDLVYSVRGETEKAVPLPIPQHATTVSGRHTLFLEDLDVRPGDFISYYVRARDVTRGTRPNEARSDIFFLEVKPYEQEFALAQSQMSAGGGGRGSLDDLIAAQKEVIVATWKLDRRALAAKGAKSESDIRAVSRAEAELKSRVERASSGFRETAMRDPRRRTQPQRGGRGGPPQPELRAGQTMAEEDEMSAAAAAMEQAVSALDALKTADARPPEMEALNHLLKAQADVKKREVMQQQAGSGAGSNRSNYDLSTLFDKELQKQQQTNYETKSSTEQRDDPSQSALDKVRELARRQDELLKKQQQLARARGNVSEEELKRELEKLTREQSELRQKAEELARQLASQPPQGEKNSQASQSPGSQSPGSQSPGSQSPGAQGGGSQGQGSPQSGRGSQSGQSSQGSQGATASSSQMREASEAMRAATNDMRRQDQGQAAASASRALEKLRELERQMQSGRPDEKRRAVGEMQLEARQLADAQRQIAAELGRTGAGEAGKDTVRKLAGEQERLAERARRLQEAMKQQGPATPSAEVAKEIEGQKIPDRMQRSAEAMRAAADRGAGTQRGTTAPPPAAAGVPGIEEAKGQAGAQQELARALDRAAQKLAAATGAADGEAGKLSDQLARTQELQEKIDRLTEQMKQLAGSPQGQGRETAGSRGTSSNGASSTGASSTGTSSSSASSTGKAPGGSEAARLRDEAQRAMQETRELMEQLRREDPSFSRGGAGFTFEGQGMSTSSPGTEGFKQDFARWEDLRRQATQALETAQTAIAKKLQAKEAKERLAAGADDKAPAEYQKQVDDYFKAIAAKKKGS